MVNEWEATSCPTLTHIHRLLPQTSPSGPETWTVDFPRRLCFNRPPSALSVPRRNPTYPVLSFAVLRTYMVHRRLSKHLLDRISCWKNLMNWLCRCCSAKAAVFFYHCISIGLWKENILRSAALCYSQFYSHWYVVQFPNHKWKITYLFQTVVHWWNKSLEL